MKQTKTTMKSWILGTAAFAAVLCVLTPVLRVRAQGNSTLKGLKNFSVDCQKPTVDAPSFQCTGDLVGSSQLVSTVSVGNSLGRANSDWPCGLNIASDVLTAADGSTLNLISLGMLCTQVSAEFAVRHNAYIIEGGTGRFQGATGTGNIVHATENPIGLPLIHIDGNINLP